MKNPHFALSETDKQNFEIVSETLEVKAIINEDKLRNSNENLSKVIGIGAIFLILFSGLSTSLIWVAGPGYISKCSNAGNKGRLFGVFYLLYRTANFIGNIGSVWLLGTFNAYVFYWVMISLSLTACILFLFVPHMDVV